MLPQMFIISLIIFHTSRVPTSRTFHGRPNVSLKSLLITKPYLIALTFSLFEYNIEKTLFLGSKHSHCWISYAGVGMVVIGEVVRKAAIVTAGPAFGHVIRSRYQGLPPPCDVRHIWDHASSRVFRVLPVVSWDGSNYVYPVSMVAFGIIVFRFFSDRVRTKRAI